MNEKMSTTETAKKIFRDEVLAGLSKTPRHLPYKFFYDEEGAQLFRQICDLPEYYITRTEIEILRLHGAEMAKALGRQIELIGYPIARRSFFLTYTTYWAGFSYNFISERKTTSLVSFVLTYCEFRYRTVEEIAREGRDRPWSSRGPQHSIENHERDDHSRYFGLLPR